MFFRNKSKSDEEKIVAELYKLVQSGQEQSAIEVLSEIYFRLNPKKLEEAETDPAVQASGEFNFKGDDVGPVEEIFTFINNGILLGRGKTQVEDACAQMPLYICKQGLNAAPTLRHYQTLKKVLFTLSVDNGPELFSHALFYRLREHYEAQDDGSFTAEQVDSMGDAIADEHEAAVSQLTVCLRTYLSMLESRDIELPFNIGEQKRLVEKLS